MHAFMQCVFLVVLCVCARARVRCYDFSIHPPIHPSPNRVLYAAMTARNRRPTAVQVLASIRHAACRPAQVLVNVLFYAIAWLGVALFSLAAIGWVRIAP